MGHAVSQLESNEIVAFEKGVADFKDEQKVV
jgi:hypothetical protein